MQISRTGFLKLGSRDAVDLAEPSSCDAFMDCRRNRYLVHKLREARKVQIFKTEPVFTA